MRSFLEASGAPTQDFALLAMTRAFGLAALAAHYGVEVPMARLRVLEDALFEEVEGIRVSQAALDCLAELMDRGVGVIIGSNLALPYGISLRHALQGAGLAPGQLVSCDGIACAFSYEMGLVKPDRDFYRAIAASSSPGATFLMVGDKREEDYEAPLRQGWAAEPAKLRALDPSEWKAITKIFQR